MKPESGSPVRKALALIEQLQARLARLQQERSEPIAIVGMACRLPGGVHTPEAAWEMLAAGRSTLREVSAARRDPGCPFDPDPDAAGSTYVRAGHYLEDIERFDAAFFGISPREAEQMDPQQRLLLEVAWEALERAAQPWERLRESRTGVFVGVANYDYAQMMFRATDLREIDSFTGTGNAYSFHTGRLSYLLGLQGPSLAIDTACSSSLVALHLACTSLRARECDLALAGGVQVSLSPITEIFLCRSHALAADGRCKAFDARADGYGRGEGCGLVVLKRLSDARRDRDPVLGVVRASGVNHDGPSSGLTVPNPRAQTRLLQATLEQAGLEPHAIDYIEAHGVGTPLGDPIEMRSIASVLGAGRPPERPLYVGSIKTNIGHLEGAAGVAGLIKTVLALQHGRIPRNLNFEEPNPQIDWARLPVAVPTELQPWPHAGWPRRAAVNAFGLSGTNAHVILESAPRDEAPEVPAAESPQQDGCHLLPLSARSASSLDELCRRYERHLTDCEEGRLGDVCATAAVGRAHFEQRLAVSGSDREQLRQGLAALREGRSSPGAWRGHVASGELPRAAFLYTGQGSQYPLMGRGLYEAHPAFRRTFDRCDAFLRGDDLLGVSLREHLHVGDPQGLLNNTAFAQTALFSLEMALTELWRAWGIRPDVVTGYSLGEYAAACAAGVFELEDALRLLVVRGRLVDALPRTGRMATVFASEADLAEHLAPFAAEVGVAAVAGPEIAVVSGAEAPFSALLARLRQAGLRVLPLPLGQAFHSPLVEPMLAAYADALARVRLLRPHTPLVSNLTGREAGPELATPEYWCQHLRRTVRFYDCLRRLHGQGFEIFVELGPDPVLLGFDQCLPEDVGADARARVAWLPSLRRPFDEHRQMLESLGALYTRGFAVDWQGVHADRPWRSLVLPTYPFERKAHWGIREREITPPGRAPRSAPAEEGVPGLLERGDVEALLSLVERRTELPAEQRQGAAAVLRALGACHRETLAPARLEGSIYRTRWSPAAPSASGLPPEGPALLYGAAYATLDAIAERLRHMGRPCRRVVEGTACGPREPGTWTLRAERPEDWRALLSDLRREFAQRPLGLVLLACPPPRPGSEPGALEAEGLRSCGGLLHLLQAVSAEPWAQTCTFWVLTHGAVSTGLEDASALQPFAAPLWGAAKVAALEYPRLWGGIVDSLGVSSAQEEARRVLDEIGAGGDEDQVALRGETRLVPRLMPAELDSVAAYRFDPQARYVITGGLGFLGLSIANWAVERGARRLVLVSRRAQDDSTRDTIARLESAGAHVQHERADVTDADAMRALFTSPDGGLPVRGLFHLAGVAGYKETPHLSYEDFLRVMRPKLTGTRILHEATQGLPLDFFFCSSSLSSVWGYKGGFHYAAANAFLDAFMHARQAGGAPGLAINIGPCAGGGVAEPQFLELMEKVGVVPISPELVTAALERLLARPQPTMVARMRWQVFREIYEAQRPSPFLAALGNEGEGAGAHAAEPAHAPTVLLERLRAARASDRLDLIVQALQHEVVAMLRLDASERPDPRQGFFAMGMNSLMVMELRARVHRAFDCNLAATLVFNKPTIQALAEHLLSVLPVCREDASDAPAVAPTTAPDALDQLDELSADELERLLDRTLDDLPGEAALHGGR